MKKAQNERYNKGLFLYWHEKFILVDLQAIVNSGVSTNFWLKVTESACDKLCYAHSYVYNGKKFI